MSRGLPYRPAPKDAVRPGAWLMGRGEDLTPLPSVLFDWDYGMDLHLTRDVEVDVSAIRESSRVSEEVPLSLDVVWRADAHLRGRGAGVSLTADGEEPTRRIEFTLNGPDLGSVLSLETCVRLSADDTAAAGPVARRAGSVLWSETYRARLKGDAARFPMALVDPVAHGHDPRIPWFLDIRPELDAPAVGAINLLVNRHHHRVARAIETADRPDPEAAAILSSMYHDLGRTLMDFALGAQDLWGGQDFEEDTFGRTLSSLVRRVFPKDTEAAIREMREVDPAGFAADCAVAFGLMRSGFDA